MKSTKLKTLLLLSASLSLQATAIPENGAIYSARMGFPDDSAVSPAERSVRMEALIEEARRYSTAAKLLLPPLPAEPAAYYLEGTEWHRMRDGRFSFKQSLTERLSGSGKLVSATGTAFAQPTTDNPVFLFHETVMDDPPCIIPLQKDGGSYVIRMEKVTSAGAWVRRSDWATVRLTDLSGDWYLLEVLAQLPEGRYALCYNLTVVPFEITSPVQTRAYLAFGQSSSSSPVKVSSENDPTTDTREGRYDDLKVPDSFFSSDDQMKPLDQKNGFQELRLGSTPAPAGFKELRLPNIGADNHARNYNPLLDAFEGKTSVQLKGGRIIPGEQLMSTEYFMGGLGRSSTPAKNVWVEAVKDPEGVPMVTRPAIVNLFPNDVVVYASDSTRRVNGVTVGHIGLNYIGGRLAGIVMQYELNDEPKLVETFTAAFGKPYRDRKASSYKWSGDRVNLQIGEGYIRYSSLPILQAVAGFLGSGDAPSQEQALDAL
ncbi:MAG: hypothetical protein ACPGSB_10720 [Opitutales bacterium]